MHYHAILNKDGGGIMLDTELSTYLCGVLDLACELSDWIGYSSIGVSVYTVQDWQTSFCRHYHIKPFTIVPARETFYQSLVQWLGSTKFQLAQKVVSRITYQLGEPLAVYRAEDENALTDILSSAEGGLGPYYFTEGVFFVEFKTRVLAFIMGNCE